MSRVFLSTAGTSGPPIDTVPLPPGLSTSWVGWDGSVWPLDDPQSSLILGKGVQGLSAPEYEFYSDDLVGTDGTLDRGYRIKAREVFWPLAIATDRVGQSWLDTDSSFWITMQPGRLGSWVVSQPGGAKRTLQCRYASQSAASYEVDPASAGFALYGINLLAPDPFWRGDPIVRRWGGSPGEPFFGGDAGGGFGPPYAISPAATIATATMRNTGDVSAWPIWTVFGPSTSVTLGLNGRLIQVPFTIADGAALVIDTNPTVQTAFDATVEVAPNGDKVAVVTSNERTGDLGATDYAPIPPGSAVPLSLAMSGTGTIQASVTPGYLRAW